MLPFFNKYYQEYVRLYHKHTPVSLSYSVSLMTLGNMGQYKLKCWYEWHASGDCLWAADKVTEEKYGYNPAIANLPLSRKLVMFLNETGDMHDGALNWDYPPDPPDPEIWTPEKEAEFDKRAHEGYERICQ